MIVGGRNYRLTPQALNLLDNLNEQHKFIILLNGLAKGIDQSAKEWAESSGIKVKGFAAQWDKLGKRAGPLRNQLMVNELKPFDVCVFFPGNCGTDGCIELARKSSATIIDYRHRIDLVK